MLTRRVEQNRKYFRLILIWGLIFFFIWVLTWKSEDSNEILPRTINQAFIQPTQPKIIFPSVVPAKVWQPKISEINVLDHLDKILDYEPNHEVFTYITDLVMREKILRLRALLKEKNLVEERGMSISEDMEAEILKLLKEFKGPDYM